MFAKRMLHFFLQFAPKCDIIVRKNNKNEKGIFFVNTSQTKEHCESSALLFGNEAHLRRMKRVAEQLMKQGFAL